MRLYTVQFNAVAMTVQQDLFELVAPSTGILILHELGLSQSTELGDAAEESLAILLKSGATTSGSGGSSVTPVAIDFGDPASGATAEANNTTKANTGTIVTHEAHNWNIRVPFQRIWTPETRPVIRPSRRFTVELAATPTDSITGSGYMIFAEHG